MPPKPSAGETTNALLCASRLIRVCADPKQSFSITGFPTQHFINLLLVRQGATVNYGLPLKFKPKIQTKCASKNNYKNAHLYIQYKIKTYTHKYICRKKNEKYPHGNDYVNWKINILLLISIHSKFLTIFQKVSHIIILIIKMFFLLEIYLSQY